MNYPAYFDDIRDIRMAMLDPSGVTDEQLQQWVQDAERVGDQWMRTQLARLLVKTRRGHEVWGHIVLGWLYQSAKKKSWWTDELVTVMLEGWPDLFVNSSMGASVGEIHPQGVAQGLLNPIRSGQIFPRDIPNIWISRLVAAADRGSLFERHAVAEFLAEARAGENRWGLKVLEWLRRMEHSDSTWKARMVKLLIKGWPNLIASRFSLDSLNIDHEQLAQAVSIALLKGWLHKEDLPRALIHFLQHHGQQQIHTLQSHAPVSR